MARFDEARFALEAATAQNTILTTMWACPPLWCASRASTGRTSSRRTDEPAAFVVGGKIKDCIYISKYLNIVERGRAYSLPNRDPAHTLTIDEARRACAVKGPGWHLLTNAEWMAVAFWSLKNGTLPRGNNQ
jgi:hypothetical protein